MEERQVCIYCGGKATRWCDLVIGFDNADGGLATVETPVYRCDAPLCEDHAEFKGNIFFSGSPKVAGVESVDHCCAHEEFWRQGLGGEWHADTERWEPIDADEAGRRRYRHRCQATGLRLVPPSRQGARMSEIELPEPAEWRRPTAYNMVTKVEGLYTAEQVRAAILAERERCARIADDYGNKLLDTTFCEVSAAIRRGSV